MRRALESVYQIISSLSHSSGQGYFDTFVSEIAAAVGADFVLISGRIKRGSLSRYTPPTPRLSTSPTSAFRSAPPWGDHPAGGRDLVQRSGTAAVSPCRRVAGLAHPGLCRHRPQECPGETVGICSVLFATAHQHGQGDGPVAPAGSAGRARTGADAATAGTAPARVPRFSAHHDVPRAGGDRQARSERQDPLDQPGHRKMLGYSQSELLHRTAAELNHPEDWLRSAACYEELKHGERTAFTQEKRYLHRDGQVLWGGSPSPWCGTISCSPTT